MKKILFIKKNYTVLSLDKHKILENDDNNNNNNDYKNNEGKVINIKKIIIKNKINLNGNDKNNSIEINPKLKNKENIERKIENGKEENIIGDKEDALYENGIKNNEDLGNGSEEKNEIIDNKNNKTESIYIEDES